MYKGFGYGFRYSLSAIGIWVGVIGKWLGVIGEWVG